MDIVKNIIFIGAGTGPAGQAMAGPFSAEGETCIIMRSPFGVVSFPDCGIVL